jgi:hypothetical protein
MYIRTNCSVIRYIILKIENKSEREPKPKTSTTKAIQSYFFILLLNKCEFLTI